MINLRLPKPLEGYTLRIIAYHEAGHAVIARAQGYKCIGIIVNGDRMETVIHGDGEDTEEAAIRAWGGVAAEPFSFSNIASLSQWIRVAQKRCGFPGFENDAEWGDWHWLLTDRLRLDPRFDNPQTLTKAITILIDNRTALRCLATRVMKEGEVDYSSGIYAGEAPSLIHNGTI
jgi:hypothetical protein